MSPNGYTTVLTVLTLLVVVADLIYFYWLAYRIRAKGYQTPAVALSVGIPPFVAFASGIVLFAKSDVLINTNDFTFDPELIGTSLANFGFYFVGPSLAVAVVAAVVAVTLPKRRARYAGRRDVAFPWARLGQALAAISAILLTLEWGFGVSGLYSARIVFQIFVPLLVFCFYMAGRASAPDMEAVLSTDLRAPVLYLRAFQREMDVFADVGLSTVASYTRDTWNRSAVTFEQYFAKAVTEHIGPFVALGGPEDYLPPEGAARAYADDTDWKSQFLALSARAACVLMEVDDSTSLQWELASLRERGLEHKLFVLTRPREMRGWKYPRIMAGRQVYRLMARLKGLRRVSWLDFVAATNPLGYSFPQNDPGQGAVVGIGSDGRGLVVVQNAIRPDEYLVPITAQLPVKKAFERGSRAPAVSTGRAVGHPHRHSADARQPVVRAPKTKPTEVRLPATVETANTSAAASHAQKPVVTPARRLAEPPIARTQLIGDASVEPLSVTPVRIWRSIWVGIVGQMIWAGAVAYDLVRNIVLEGAVMEETYAYVPPSHWIAPGFPVVVFVCGLGLSRLFITFRRSQDVSTIQTGPTMLLVLTAVSLAATHSFLATAILPDPTTVDWILFPGMSPVFIVWNGVCLALVWNGLRVLRTSVDA